MFPGSPRCAEKLSYREWFDARTRRLIGPVLPLLLAWGGMVAVAYSNGVSAGMIRIGSKVALVPVWFLAVYIMVVALVPLSHAAWKRWGFASVAIPVVAAALVDVAFFAGDLRALGWFNYPFVWLAVHQLGYAWHDRKLAGPRVGMPLFVVGILSLVALTHFGPYPLSLVGVPSDEVSNTLPPKLPLLALAAAQIGLVMMLETSARRWLQRRVPWAATILVNGMIMTIFLWHSTVMMLLVGLAFWVMPGRPRSTAGYLRLVVDATVVAFRLRVGDAALPARIRPLRAAGFGRSHKAGRGGLQLLGCTIACAGLAMLALDGVGGDGWLGLRWIPLLTPLIGAGLAGFGPLGAIGRVLSGVPAKS